MVSFAKPALNTVLLLLLVVVAYCDRSYYDVLGVPKSASQSQIKAAYRKLSKQYHPDVSQEVDAKAKFQEVSEAYQVLSDEEQKKVYDRSGKEGLKQRQQQGGGGHPFGDIQDIFGSFFGGGGGFMKRKAQPLVLKVILGAKELYTGVKLSFIVNKRVECERNCQSGYESYSLDIPAGTRGGEEFTVQDGFNEYQNAEPSDLVFRIVEINTPGFERNGLNLIYRLTVSLKEALLGFKKVFTNLDGEAIEVQNNTEVTQHGQQIRVRSKGFPDRRSGSRGDLVVTAHIDMPRHLSHDQLQGSRL